MSEFTELEQDALMEIFNIGVGRAAASLSQMLGDELHMSVPSIDIYPKRVAIDTLSENFPFVSRTIKQHFMATSAQTQLAGHAFLIFPEESSVSLLHAMSVVSDNTIPTEEITQEVLVEVGNVVLNACLGVLANMLNDEWHCDIPEYHQEQVRPVLINLARKHSYDQMPQVNMVPVNRRRPDWAQEKVLYLTIRFHGTECLCKGHLVLFLDLETAPNLKDGLHQLLEKHQKTSCPTPIPALSTES